MSGRGHAGPEPAEATTTLSAVPPGRRATIIGVLGQTPPAVADRLRQLGFRPAATVEVIRRAPLGDPTIYRVLDTELCLRRSEARLIEVVEETRS